MNSCLYRCKVMHNRMKPKQHRFHYNIFMFYIDLDELEMIRKKFWLIGLNRFNVFSFRDKDHLRVDDTLTTTSDNIRAYLKKEGIEIGKGKIMLLTHLRTLGYQFNPVSFYFCYSEHGDPLCTVAEVSNTFGEMKPYVLKQSTLKDQTFRDTQVKYFYVSPFIDHDASFDFQLELPGEKLNIRIDDIKEGDRFFISTLTGTKRALTNLRLLGYLLRFPLITLQVILLIEWNALRLWLKKVPHRKKNAHPELQRDVYKR